PSDIQSETQQTLRSSRPPITNTLISNVNVSVNLLINLHAVKGSDNLTAIPDALLSNILANYHLPNRSNVYKFSKFLSVCDSENNQRLLIEYAIKNSIFNLKEV